MTNKISFILIVLLLSSVAYAKPPYENINNQELIELMQQNIPVYDIRRPEEWAQTGIVKNSITMTFFHADGSVNPDFMPKFTSKIGKDDPFILICRTGNRTSTLANYLGTQVGYTRVYNVENGIMGWLRDKQPVTAYKGK